MYPNELGGIAITCTCIAVCVGMDVNIKGHAIDIEKERLSSCVCVCGRDLVWRAAMGNYGRGWLLQQAIMISYMLLSSVACCVVIC